MSRTVRLLVAVACCPLLAYAAENPKLETVTPQLRDLGTDWLWPWDAVRQSLPPAAEDGPKRPPPQIPSPEQWKQQFWLTKDPRTELRKEVQKLQAMSDVDFQTDLGNLATVFGYLFQTGVVASAELSSAVLTQEIKSLQITRPQLVDQLQKHLTNIVDFTYVEFHRFRAAATPAGDEGRAMPERDILGLRYVAFSNEYCESRAIYSDLSPMALTKFVQVMEAQNKRTLAEHEEELVELAADADRTRDNLANLRRELDQAREDQKLTPEQVEKMEKTPANLERLARRVINTPQHVTELEQNVATMEKILAKQEKRMDQIMKLESKVDGALLQNVDGGYVVWMTQTLPEARSIMVSGKLRRGAVVVEFSRVALGSYTDGALDDTQRILTLIAKKLEPYLLANSVRGELKVVPQAGLQRSYHPSLKKSNNPPPKDE